MKYSEKERENSFNLEKEIRDQSKNLPVKEAQLLLRRRKIKEGKFWWRAKNL